MPSPPKPGPRRLPAHTTPDPWPYGQVEAGEDYRQLNLVDLDWAEVDAVRFQEVRIVRARWAKRHHRRWRFEETSLQACDLGASEWLDLSGEGLRLEACRLTGARWPKAKLKRASLIDCQASYWMAEGLVLQEAEVVGGCYVEANFEGADLRGVRFAGCDLRDASFAGAQLAGADFRGANLEAARVLLGDLSGAVVSEAQALALFLRHTGAVLEPQPLAATPPKRARLKTTG